MFTFRITGEGPSIVGDVVLQIRRAVEPGSMTDGVRRARRGGPRLAARARCGRGPARRQKQSSNGAELETFFFRASGQLRE